MKLALCHDLLKIERLPPARLVARGDGFLRKRTETDWGFAHIFISSNALYIHFFGLTSLDNSFVLYAGNSLHGRSGASAGVHGLF